MHASSSGPQAGQRSCLTDGPHMRSEFLGAGPHPGYPHSRAQSCTLAALPAPLLLQPEGIALGHQSDPPLSSGITRPRASVRPPLIPGCHRGGSPDSGPATTGSAGLVPVGAFGNCIGGMPTFRGRGEGGFWGGRHAQWVRWQCSHRHLLTSMATTFRAPLIRRGFRLPLPPHPTSSSASPPSPRISAGTPQGAPLSCPPRPPGRNTGEGGMRGRHEKEARGGEVSDPTPLSHFHTPGLHGPPLASGPTGTCPASALSRAPSTGGGGGERPGLAHSMLFPALMATIRSPLPKRVQGGTPLT